MIYFVLQCSGNFTSSCMSIVAIELNKDISNLACNIILSYYAFLSISYKYYCCNEKWISANIQTSTWQWAITHSTLYLLMHCKKATKKLDNVYIVQICFVGQSETWLYIIPMYCGTPTKSAPYFKHAIRDSCPFSQNRIPQRIFVTLLQLETWYFQANRVDLRFVWKYQDRYSELGLSRNRHAETNINEWRASNLIFLKKVKNWGCRCMD